MQIGRQLMANAAASVLVIGTAVAVAQPAVASPPAQNVQKVRVAAGPIGGGWQEYHPSKNLQIQSGGKYTTYPWASTEHARGPGGSYDRGGGTEKFRLFNNGTNRVEVRVKDNYSSGMLQFEGDLRVSSPTNNESCMQIFGRPGGGAMMMIRAYSANGGTLRALGMNATLATGIYGKWVHLNVIHDATARRVTIYVNGSSAGTWGGSSGEHYFKYGIYGTLRTPTAQTEWRNVKFYRK
jgi:hypothetical protein